MEEAKEANAVRFSIPDEDSAGTAVLWKSKAEELADYVAEWVDYQDGMIVTVLE